MNIAYLTQITHLDRSNRNPLEYIKDYDKPEYISIMPTHLLSINILEWASADEMPENAIDLFIESRVATILTDLKTKLNGLTFDVMDTMEMKEPMTTELE